MKNKTYNQFDCSINEGERNNSSNYNDWNHNKIGQHLNHSPCRI
nr:MAG TPA: hypothetical protein [Caudoviricetes sp.]